MNVAAQQVSGKERIRGPDLAILVKRSSGVPMEEALRRADESNLVIASNKRLSTELVGSNEWKSISDVFACWSGTMTAYDTPDKKLGKTIDYTDSEKGIRYVFPVPKEHQGKKNVVLVTEHPNFTLETDGKTRIVQAKKVGIVSKFPAASQTWYLGDPEYDIPQGNEVSDTNQDARYLWRIEKRVGLVARGYYYWGGYNYRRNVFLNDAPSVGFGVAVEASEGGAPLAAGTTKLKIVTQEQGHVLLAGSEEQLQAALRVLRSQNLL